MQTKLAIICPCFNEEEILSRSAIKLKKKIDELIIAGKCSPESYIVLVDDGSSDNTWAIIEEITKKTKSKFKGIKLVTNVGHQNALVAGINYVTRKCDACITMDVDLQDDIDVIDRMLSFYQEGYQIVLGVKKTRTGDSIFKKITAKLYYKSMKLMGVDLVENHADFRLLSDQALKNFELFGEKIIFLRAIQMKLHSKIAKIEYAISARELGASKYTLKKMLNLAWSGITSFSTVPLRLIGILGFLISAISVLMVMAIIVSYLMKNSVPGWASTVIPVYLMGGITMLSVGILGEYIGKIYEEVKLRPSYIIEQISEYNV